MLYKKKSFEYNNNNIPHVVIIAKIDDLSIVGKTGNYSAQKAIIGEVYNEIWFLYIRM